MSSQLDQGVDDLGGAAYEYLKNFVKELLDYYQNLFDGDDFIVRMKL